MQGLVRFGLIKLRLGAWLGSIVAGSLLVASRGKSYSQFSHGKDSQLEQLGTHTHTNKIPLPKTNIKWFCHIFSLT